MAIPPVSFQGNQSAGASGDALFDKGIDDAINKATAKKLSTEFGVPEGPLAEAISKLREACEPKNANGQKTAPDADAIAAASNAVAEALTPEDAAAVDKTPKPETPGVQAKTQAATAEKSAGAESPGTSAKADKAESAPKSHGECKHGPQTKGADTKGTAANGAPAQQASKNAASSGASGASPKLPNNEMLAELETTLKKAGVDPRVAEDVVSKLQTLMQKIGAKSEGGDKAKAASGDHASASKDCEGKKPAGSGSPAGTPAAGSNTPKTEQSKTEQSKTDTHKDCPPKTEPLKAEPPKTEPPKTEQSKTDMHKDCPPKAEPPKTEPPKTNTQKDCPPKAEPPKTDAHKDCPPKSNPSAQQPPKTEHPKTEHPKTEHPKTEHPKTEQPKTDTHKDCPPKGGASAGQPPKTDTPASNPAKASPGTSGGKGFSPESMKLNPEIAKYEKEIMAAAKASGQAPEIIAAQIWAESRGKAGANSKNGDGSTDIGLMQIGQNRLKKDNFSPTELQEFKAATGKNPEDLNVNDPADNIMAGAFHLKHFVEKNGGNLSAGLFDYVARDTKYVANVNKFAYQLMNDEKLSQDAGA